MIAYGECKTNRGELSGVASVFDRHEVAIRVRGGADLAEVDGAKSGGRIAEHRRIGEVARFETDFDALSFLHVDALQQGRVQCCDTRSAVVQVAGSGTRSVGCGLREGRPVEVVVNAVLNAARGAGVTDQVGTLCAVPYGAAGLGNLNGHAALHEKHTTKVPAADEPVQNAIHVRANRAALAERQFVGAGHYKTASDVMRG